MGGICTIDNSPQCPDTIIDPPSGDGICAGISCTISDERREPPGKGPRCYGKRCEERWSPFQARIDKCAARLIANQVQLNVVEKAKNRPVIFQYGDPACTVLTGTNRLDVEQTLACARSERKKTNPAGICDIGGGVCTQGRIGHACATDADCDALSLQAHLLGSGVCGVGGQCTGGRVGLPCSDDFDCGIIARAHNIPRNSSEAAIFFPDFIDSKVREQACPEP